MEAGRYASPFEKNEFNHWFWKCHFKEPTENLIILIQCQTVLLWLMTDWKPFFKPHAALNTYFSFSFLSNWTSAVSGMQQQSLISKSHLYVEIQSKKERSAEVKPPAHPKKGRWSSVCVCITQPCQPGSSGAAPSHRAPRQGPRAPGRGGCCGGSSAAQLLCSFPASLRHRCSLPWLKRWHCSPGALGGVPILSPRLWLCKGGVSGSPPRLTQWHVSYSQHNL